MNCTSEIQRKGFPKHGLHALRHRWLCGLVACAAMSLASCGSGGAEPTGQMTTKPDQAPVKAKTVEYRNIKGCFELSAGDTRMIVAPSWAGRVAMLDFGRGNVMLHDKRVDGKILKPTEGWFWWDGNATDAAKTVADYSKGKWNQYENLWLHPYPNVEFIDGGMKLSSLPNDSVHLSASKTYKLGADGKSVTYSYNLSCSGGAPTGWTVWERILVDKPEYVIAPVRAGGAYEKGWFVRDNTTIKPAELAKSVGEYLVIRPGVKDGAGLAAELSAGWIADVRESGVFVITYPIAKDGKYPHYKGGNAIFWLAEKAIEIEPLAAEAVLKPGQSTTFTQVWHWLAWPDGLDRSDEVAVGKWIAQQVAKLSK